MASRRFNVLLTEEQYARLTREAERTSVSIGELIRRSIDATFKLDGDRKTPGVELSIGVWRRPDAAIAGRRPGVRFER